MNHAGVKKEMRVSSAELQTTLQSILGHQRGVVRQMRRRPSPNGSSFALEELDISFADGQSLALIFKNLGPDALLKEGRLAKPAFLLNPRREIDTYRAILQFAEMGTALFYGAVDDAAAGHYWLFVERVLGEELYQVGAFEIWLTVARWLAGMHSRFGNEAASVSARAPLLKYDDAFFRHWPERARAFLNETALQPTDRVGLDRLLRRYDQVIECLLRQPITLIHGDFYASNVLIQETPQGVRVCPVDWEMAAVGPGLIDLATLMAGKWTSEQQDILALTYYDALPTKPAGLVSREAYMNALDCCRLHCAMQCLGWSADWSPPATQAHDWLADALSMAARLGL